MKKVIGVLRVSSREMKKLTIVEQSVDTRKKPDIWCSYVVDVGVRRAGFQKKEKLARKLKDRNMPVHKETPYRFPEPGTSLMTGHPVITGIGPVGLSCGLMLARKGYMPIPLECGENVGARTNRVTRFWGAGQLSPSPNVQFGKGGAGTFPDGELSTLVKDTSGGNREVLCILTEFGGGPLILCVDRPHIGIDVLGHIVKSIRTKIKNLSGEVRFLSQVTDFATDREQEESGHVKILVINDSQILTAETAALAIGHSTRGIFKVLLTRETSMEPKASAVGLKAQHPQALISESQCGIKGCGELGPASYKPTWKSSDGRGVYPFYTCPGGCVIGAPFEPGCLAINGIDYHGGAGEDANSAIIITVTPEDSGGIRTESGIETEPGMERDYETPGDVVAGVRFQGYLEETTFCLGEGSIPIQLYGDFETGRVSDGFGGVNPAFRDGYAFANLRELFPEPLSRAFMEGMEGLGTMIRGFDRPNAILTGIESRTSSLVYISRDQGMEGFVRGISPCGEGAGYADGVTSAAMDGIKTAEEIIHRYNPLGPF